MGGVGGAADDFLPPAGHGNEDADPAWNVAFTFLTEWLRVYYEDDNIVAQHYDSIKLHVTNLYNKTVAEGDDGLLTYSIWSGKSRVKCLCLEELTSSAPRLVPAAGLPG